MSTYSYLHPVSSDYSLSGGLEPQCISNTDYIFNFHPEVVLSLLIESFRFSPSKAEIAWQMTGVVTPAVVGTDLTKPQLPLIVERV